MKKITLSIMLLVSISIGKIQSAGNAEPPKILSLRKQAAKAKRSLPVNLDELNAGVSKENEPEPAQESSSEEEEVKGFTLRSFFKLRKELLDLNTPDRRKDQIIQELKKEVPHLTHNIRLKKRVAALLKMQRQAAEAKANMPNEVEIEPLDLD